MNPTIEITTYKNKPILAFKNDKRVFFSFGLRKAILIIENIDKIKEFVQENIKDLSSNENQAE